MSFATLLTGNAEEIAKLVHGSAEKHGYGSARVLSMAEYLKEDKKVRTRCFTFKVIGRNMIWL